jgi:hypothetical protein
LAKKKPCGAISSGISLFSINDLFSTLVELCECGNLSWSMAGCYHSARDSIRSRLHCQKAIRQKKMGSERMQSCIHIR